MMRARTVALAIVGMALVAGGAYVASTKRHVVPLAQAPLATPVGVTIQNVKLGVTDSGIAGYKAPLLKPAFADAKGMTLYTFDKDAAPGKPTCTGDCAKAWTPLAAPADAAAFGDWSIVAHDDGAKQWAFRGKPLYTSTKDKKLSDAEGNGADGVWHVALFRPTDGLVLPDGVSAEELLNAGGVVFVGTGGMPLYTFDGDRPGKPACTADPCASEWSPLVAAEVARPVGDFTVIHRDDGIDQWAYKGWPLYSYAGDTEAGDAKGDGLDGKWHVATLLRQFMPSSVAIMHNRYGGDNLATSAGMTLYVRDRVVGTNTGHNLRTGIRTNPMVGRILGTADCDATCLKTWHPLAAPAGAVASGYWEVATRPDGARQWSYRGFPVYTFVGDKKPGDMKGNDTYDIMPESDPFTVADIGIKGAGAMVWHAAIP